MTVYTKARLRKAVKTGVFGDVFTKDDGTPALDEADLKLELVRVDRFYPDSYRAKVTYRDSIIDIDPDQNPRTEMVQIGSSFISSDIEMMVIPDGAEIDDGEVGERCIIPNEDLIGVILAIGGDFKDRGGVLLGFVHMPDEDRRQFEKDIILLRNSDSFMKIKNDEIIIQAPNVKVTKGGLQAPQRVLVGNVNIPDGSPVTSASVTGLNGNVDRVYEIEFNLKIFSDTEANFLFKPNGTNVGETFTHYSGQWTNWIHNYDQSPKVGQLIRLHGSTNPRYAWGQAKFFTSTPGKGINAIYTTRDANKGVLTNTSTGSFENFGDNITSLVFGLNNGDRFAGWIRVFTYR